MEEKFNSEGILLWYMTFTLNLQAFVIWMLKKTQKIGLTDFPRVLHFTATYRSKKEKKKVQ